MIALSPIFTPTSPPSRAPRRTNQRPAHPSTRNAPGAAPGDAPGDEPSARELIEAANSVDQTVLDRPDTLLDTLLAARMEGHPDPDPALDVPELDAFRLYIRDVLALDPPRGPRLSRDQALAAARRGDTQRLVEGSLLLVVAVAVAVHRRARHLSLLDMVEQGNIGLLEAARRFDAARGCAFSSYAIWWIRKHVYDEALAQDAARTVLSPRDIALLRRLKRERVRLERETGRLWALADVAGWLHKNTAPPRKYGHWPSPGEVSDWLIQGDGVCYLSQLALSQATRPARAGRVAADGAAHLSTYGERLAAPDPQEDTSIAPRNILRLARDLRALYDERALSEDETLLVVLRAGAVHPDPLWCAPAGWHLGATHSHRWLAHILGIGLATAQRRLDALDRHLRTLGADSVPSVAPAARRLLAELAAPAQLICFSHLT